MSSKQLDLFSFSAVESAAQRAASIDGTPHVIAWSTLDDDGLIAALPQAGLRDSLALAGEVGRRRLAAAIPGLEALCRRFAGFGADRLVPEQAAALDALAMIGGPDAAQTIARLIAKRVVQGPCLQKAVTACARFGAKLPAATALELLRHDDPQIRADACPCARLWPESVPLLRELLEDLHSNVRTAAACALGGMGQSEVRPLLTRYILATPSAELIDAIACIADEDCIVLLGRVARGATDLSEAALNALDEIDHPRAKQVAAAIRERIP